MSVESLGVWDRLLHAIGAVAQAHVALELTTRQLFTTLAAPGLGGVLAPRSLSGLVDGCRAMLEKADVPEEVTAGGLGTLQAIRASDDRRNRSVHDRWVASLEADGPALDQWQLVKGTLTPSFRATKRDVAYVRDASTAIRRADIRASGFLWALYETLPFWRGSRLGPSELPKWLAVMDDRFSLMSDGGFRIDLPDQD